MLRPMLSAALLVCLCTAGLAPLGAADAPSSNSAQAGGASEPAEIGSRRELFVDDWLIDSLDGAELKLHHPTPREVVLQFDRPNEGNTSCYVAIVEDGDLLRMYYRGSSYDWEQRESQHQVVCYAESDDGIVWRKPELGLFEFNGSKANNIVWVGTGVHNFAPFKDTNPECAPDARFKALAGGKGGLVPFASADGIHWRQLQQEPVITWGAFDSQNLAFYDAVRGRYVDFHRIFSNKTRAIATCTSTDFLYWTEPQEIDQGSAEPQHLYTNATIAYHRAPHIFLSFPMRLMPRRQQAYKPTPEHDMPGVTDGVLMASRDGLHWRRWDEAFIRPGQNDHRWWQRNNMTAWGIVETPSDLPGGRPELSLYSSENYYIGPGRLRRYTLRLDGFVSVNAPYAGGGMTTRPFTFEGDKLEINFASSAAGDVRCELQQADGTPIAGFTLDECEPIYGDRLAHVVAWKQGSDVSSLAGKSVRLKVALRDADLYSLRFAPKND